jgi:hypothetical protein
MLAGAAAALLDAAGACVAAADEFVAEVLLVAADVAMDAVVEAALLVAAVLADAAAAVWELVVAAVTGATAEVVAAAEVGAADEDEPVVAVAGLAPPQAARMPIAESVSPPLQACKSVRRVTPR